MHAAWLREAWRELGQRERAGSPANTRIVAMYRDAGHAQVVSDEVAWCAAFCGACLERTGLRSTRSLLARSYLQWGTQLTEPRLGAIAVLSRGADPRQGHVGFWLGETDAEIVLLGGNQSDSVSVALYPKSRLLSLRWPVEEAVAPANSDVTTFDTSLAHVLDMEGGYTNDPYDPGGPTNFGVTLGVYAAHRKVTISDANRAALIGDLKAIAPAVVREIYLQRYWKPASCAELPPALALMHFDAAVNHGVGSAIHFLQEAVGADVDGEIGPQTRAAVAKAAIDACLTRYAVIRERRYRALPHFWRFGRGWLTRVSRTLEAARKLVRTPNPQNSKQGDQDMTTTTSADQKWWGHSVTIWGTLITVLSTVLPALAPVTGIDVSGDLVENAGQQVVQAVQSIGTLVGTLLTIYGRVRATKPIALSLTRSKV